MVFTGRLDAERFEDDIWICDSGESSHHCVLDRDIKHQGKHSNWKWGFRNSK
jgi:hypothetical protein